MGKRKYFIHAEDPTTFSLSGSDLHALRYEARRLIKNFLGTRAASGDACRLKVRQDPSSWYLHPKTFFNPVWYGLESSHVLLSYKTLAENAGN